MGRELTGVRGRRTTAHRASGSAAPAGHIPVAQILETFLDPAAWQLLDVGGKDRHRRGNSHHLAPSVAPARHSACPWSAAATCSNPDPPGHQRWRADRHIVGTRLRRFIPTRAHDNVPSRPAVDQQPVGIQRAGNLAPAMKAWPRGNKTLFRGPRDPAIPHSRALRLFRCKASSASFRSAEASSARLRETR